MKRVALDALPQIRRQNANRKIAHCHGVYDLLHYGHLLHLRSAREMGDMLVVSITADRFVNKGPGRPHNTAGKRAEMLAALEVVDHVCINEAPTALPVIRALSPDLYIKGPDYRNKDQDITGEIYAEEAAVIGSGGALAFTNDESDSSTRILNQYFNTWNSEQRETIQMLRKVTSPEEIEAILHQIKGMKVLVTGEPIIDTYTFCTPLALSSKSPSISAEYINEENYPGGTLAIARHLAALGCQVSLLAPHGNEPLMQSLLADVGSQENIELCTPIVAAETPRKNRYIQPFRSQRLFEITNVNNQRWMQQDMGEYTRLLADLADKSDLTIVADFGHGLFEGDTLASLQKLGCPVALNVQTNSSNFGFNVFTKHSRFDYLCVDERELRLGMHDRYQDVVSLATKAFRNHGIKALATTLGGQGSLYLWGTGAEERIKIPAFFSETVDTTGAGDAYFALTAVLERLQIKPAINAFLGNVFAGMKSRIIGNKTAVDAIQFIRAVRAILT